MAEAEVYLGLDLSTQSVSSLAISSDGKVLHRETVNFDSELPAYGTTSGMTVKGDSVVTSPAGMWLEGLDLLFSRIDKDLLAKVRAISASAQQHGSVYWKRTGEESLRALDPSKSLKESILGALLFEDCPIWADSSTETQCAQLEQAMGGPQAVADATGSRAYARFTGNQIAKIAQQQGAKWEACERVALVSSFLSSLLLGSYAPIDYSDGSGMNLMDLRSKKWHPEACAATAPGLPEKLGPDPVAPSTVLGTVCKYWTGKYGVGAGCKVVCCSGDNPNSIVGTGLLPGEVGVSLGTSDTLMGIAHTPAPRLHGHLMPHPSFPAAFFAMLVYKNGARARSAVCDAACGGAWSAFEASLAKSQPGNNGKLLLHLPLPEITPHILATGVHREEESGAPAPGPFSDDEEVRGVVEARALSMRLHAQEIGIAFPPARVVLTGGSAQNKRVCKVMADVFGCAVEVNSQAVGDTAALGAALRAQEAATAPDPPGGTETERQRDTETASAEAARGTKRQRRELTVVATPDPDATAVYTAMLARFKAFEARVAALPAAPS